MGLLLKSLFFNAFIFAYLRVTKGCHIDGVTNWLLPVTETILDTYSGNIFDRSTSDIVGISNIIHNEGLNAGPYVTVEFTDNNRLVVFTNSNYTIYEELETAFAFTFSVTLNCLGGTTRILVFEINVSDTNNNDPQFKPTSNYEITIAPPLPPGFLITNCVNDIIVRDIDLTTERIDFALEGSPLFEIVYDESSSVPKEFKAILRTTTFIRSIPDPIILTVTATDVDRTNDPRRTATATVKILTDGDFEFPDEPIFSQTFYLASYNKDDGFVLQNSIYLRQGYDKQVVFSFQTQHSQYFELIVNENEVSFEANALPEELYKERQIYIIVKAERQYTSGATATVILQLPDEPETEDEVEFFDKVLYNGQIEDGVANHEVITITRYNGSSILLFGEYASSFEATLLNDQISVIPRASATFPTEISHIAIALQGGRATAVLVFKIISSGSEVEAIESFDEVLYRGTLNNGNVIHETITLSEYKGSEVLLTEDYASSFEASYTNGIVSVQTRTSATFPTELPHIALTLQAGSAKSVLLLKVISSESEIESFDKILYKGDLKNGIVSHDVIILSNYDDSNVLLSGDYASFFESSVSDGKVSVQTRASASLPSRLTHVALTLQAGSARAVLVLEVNESESETNIESFDEVLYKGALNNGVVSHDVVLLSDYTESNIILSGDYASSFESSLLDGKVLVQKRISATLPPEITYITLTLQAGRARAVLVLEVRESGSETDVSATFDKILYTGKLEDGNVSHEIITIRDFSGSNILIAGAHSSLFESSLSNGVVTIRARTSVEFPSDLTHIALTLQAERASSVLLLDIIVTGSEIDTIESFDKVLYRGNITTGVVSHDVISLSDYSESNILLSGDYASSFESSLLDGNVLVQKRISATLPPEITHITLTLQAGRANAVLVLEVFSDSEIDVSATFDKVLYTGKLEDGNVSHETITIRDFSGSNLLIDGDYASSFESSISNGVVSVRARASSILPPDLTHITLILQAACARSVLLLEVVSGSTPEEVESFDKILYTGRITNGLASHETISISQYNENILLLGEHASLFESSLSNGIVSVTVRTSAIFPNDLTHTALTLQAGRARAVLLLDITISNDLPLITFDKPSYFLWANVGQTGIVGKVQATANNGDTVTYSLGVNDDHLRSRITVNNDGDISLSDVAQVGVYSFSVTATAQNSQASASAPVILRVDDLPQCPISKGLPPLIVLERLEEEPHQHLVTLNRTEYPDCRYSLSNIWPVDQSWLYADSDGLHTRAIDREHKSIAFMTLSQIQVELRLHCDNDEAPATKRSLTAESLELGPDNYGSNKWVLADTIEYDERRSFVNLIVNDINDNSPIFIGKENEPIYIGYPIPEIENVVLPRALIEVKATDADIGENAALIYSSSEDVLAVAPLTGLVHVRNNAQLLNNSRLTVIATDQNGRGLSGNLDFVVMLLDKHQIAVVTIQDAFLDDENIVIGDLSTAIGYELKVLRTVVVSESNENTLRKERAVTSGSGASLQLYVYGVEENKPVDVTKLTSDITNNNIVTVNVASALSLQDHLETIEICPVQGIALLVATIILAVLLLILILAIALWFFLKWRKTQNYEQFSDRNSVLSRNDTVEFPKIENITKPRLNISELKRSERRLQEMLDIPIQDVRMEPEKEGSNQIEPPPSRETIVNFSTPEMPIVIQSIDKLKDNADESEEDDEFGEKQKQKPRKSVVTFNENVEKIIHLEDGIEDSPDSDIEIFKF
ncbi:unnamed protein product, partial [Brenthis ino]